MDKADEIIQYNTLKQIIEEAYSNLYDIEEFLFHFLRSDEFKRIINYSDIKYYHPLNVLNDFLVNKTINKVDEQKISLVTAKYVIHIYLKYYYRTKESWSSIFMELPLKQIIDNYELYHTLSEERVIFISKLKYNSKLKYINKARSKNNLAINLDKDIYNLYIAKRLYYKLFTYNDLLDLEYRYYNGVNFLLNDNTLLFAKRIKNKDDLVFDCNKIIPCMMEVPNNVLFMFIEDESLMDTSLLNEYYLSFVNTIRFDKILFYHKGRILFINNPNELYEFYVTINTLDINIINKDYSNR